MHAVSKVTFRSGGAGSGNGVKYYESFWGRCGPKMGDSTRFYHEASTSKITL